MSIVSVALFMLSGFCFALDSGVSDIVIGEATHQLSFERLDRVPPLFLAKDYVAAPAKDIASFSIVATIAEDRELKTLVVTLVSGPAFPASGEMEWLFPDGEQLNLYGKTAAKALKNGTTEYAITFLTDLPRFCDCATRIANGKVFLKLYSRKGTSAEFEFPSAFFRFLSDPAE